MYQTVEGVDSATGPSRALTGNCSPLCSATPDLHANFCSFRSLGDGTSGVTGCPVPRRQQQRTGLSGTPLGQRTGRVSASGAGRPRVVVGCRCKCLKMMSKIPRAVGKIMRGSWTLPMINFQLTRAPRGGGEFRPLPDFLDSSKKAADIDAKLSVPFSASM